MPSPKLLIFIPTYNEAENAERLCRELSALGLGADILFCDDGSPDGTGEIVDELAREFSHVRAIHRPGSSESAALIRKASVTPSPRLRDVGDDGLRFHSPACRCTAIARGSRIPAARPCALGRAT